MGCLWLRGCLFEFEFAAFILGGGGLKVPEIGIK